MSTQSELKENLLAAKLDGVVEWIVARRFQVLAVGSLFLLAVLIGTFLIIKRGEDNEIRSTRLAQAEVLINQKQYAAARSILADVSRQAANQPVGLLASYYLGVVNLEDGKWADAVTAFSSVADRAGKSPLRPLAMENLGFALEQSNDFKAAAAAYGKFMESYSDHFLAPRVQLARGRSLVLAGDTAAAKDVLGQLIDIYPTSTWAQRARLIMDKVQTR
jgi:TolA-binding protein